MCLFLLLQVTASVSRLGTMRHWGLHWDGDKQQKCLFGLTSKQSVTLSQNSG
jgi:hypothetical protein